MVESFESFFGTRSRSWIRNLGGFLIRVHRAWRAVRGMFDRWLVAAPNYCAGYTLGNTISYCHAGVMLAAPILPI